MLIINREVQKMDREPTVLKRDIHWEIEDSIYVVRNVPYLEADHDGEELLDVDVSITLTALRDLMVEEAIPLDVDFTDFADIQF